jgi:DNA primase
MSIPSSFIDQILDQSDIVDIIGRRVQLNQKGNNFWGICPFHDDTNPSMAVNQDKQFYYCFVCNAKGNAINFLRDFENLDFVDAVESIASAVGLEVPKTHQTVDTTQALNINSRTVRVYEEQLKSSKGKKAIDYLKSRSISGEVAKFFNIGYSLDEWEGLFQILSKEYEKNDLTDSGLFSEKMKDRFRGRLMFPIRNIKGDHIAFGGRIIDEGEPKYLNSPETKTFSKSKELYGLYEARK